MILKKIRFVKFWVRFKNKMIELEDKFNPVNAFKNSYIKKNAMNVWTKSIFNLEYLFKTKKNRKKIIEKNIMEIKELIIKKNKLNFIFENINFKLNKIDKCIYNFIFS